jgi:hypothetical protein
MSPLVGRVRRDTSRRDVYIAICGIGRRHRTGCHRTIRANIRFDLDGGPQGSNPHFLRTYSYPSTGHKPIEARFGPRRADRRRPGPVSLCAFHPNARSLIRPSDSSARRARIEPGRVRMNPIAPSPGSVGSSRAARPDEVGTRDTRRVSAVAPEGAHLLHITSDGGDVLNLVVLGPPRGAVSWVATARCGVSRPGRRGRCRGGVARLEVGPSLRVRTHGRAG